MTKQKNVTMEKRLEALGRTDKRSAIKKDCCEFGVGTSTLLDWKKNGKYIEDFSLK